MSTKLKIVVVGELLATMIGIGIRHNSITKTIYISPAVPQMAAAAQERPSQPQTATEAKTNPLWGDYALLRHICGVESRGDPDAEPQQFEDDKKTPLWGRIKDPETGLTVILRRDVGACQINTEVWAPTYTAMKLDVVNDYFDNVTFGKWLFDHYGSSLWKASRDGSNGWGKYEQKKKP